MNEATIFGLMIETIAGSGLGQRVINDGNTLTVTHAGRVVAFAAIAVNENKVKVVGIDNRVTEVEWGPEDHDSDVNAFKLAFLQAVVAAIQVHA